MKTKAILRTAVAAMAMTALAVSAAPAPAAHASVATCHNVDANMKQKLRYGDS